MPGVVISTSVRTGPSTATVRESSQLFVVGLADRGPSDEAVLVQSIAEFEAMFGDYRSDSYLHPTVETFFEEGGTQAYVARVVGASATVGTLVLNHAYGQRCWRVELRRRSRSNGIWSNSKTQSFLRWHTRLHDRKLFNFIADGWTN
jgi:hypothetical protein